MGQALEMCKGCKTPRDCDACADLHEWIMEHMEPRWISVKDKLPEDDREYIVFNGNHALIATYWGDGEWIMDSYAIRDVTHWMPLQEPPEEG